MNALKDDVSFVLQTKIYFQTKKKTAKSISCFQNKNMKTYGLTNTLRERHHDSNCEYVNSKFKIASFFARNVSQQTGVVNPVQADVELTEMMPSTSDEPYCLS